MALTKKEAAELTIEDFLNTLCSSLPGFHELWCCSSDQTMKDEAWEKMLKDIVDSQECYWRDVIDLDYE